MSRTVTLEDASRDLSALINTMVPTDETVIVNESGNVVAVVLSPEEYRQLRREQAWASIRRVQERNAHFDPDEVLRDVTEVVEEVRRERHAKRQSSKSSVASGS